MTGRTEVQTDVATERHARLLADLLDHAAPPWRPRVLPPLGHWLLFPPLARQSALGDDGHPRRGGDNLVPANDLPRRMWAGSRIRFLADVPLGSEVTRETSLAAATPKVGRSGRMLFVTLAHRLSVEGAVAIEEEQDLVYREAAAPGSTTRPPAPETPAVVPPDHRRMQADPVQLFRYSALTYNGHRIHYDRDYATGVEHYPGLIVHGPYLATLLMDHYLRAHPAAKIARFAFRAMRPVFDQDPFTLAMTAADGGAELAVIDTAGGVAIAAEIAADQSAEAAATRR